MGFYGNITYNTYGIQQKQIKPEHLDREYWRIKTQFGITSEKEFRKFLGISDENGDYSIEKIEQSFYDMKKTMYYFSFDNENIQKLFGTGNLIAYFFEDDTRKQMWCLSVGSRSGQVFQYPLLRLKGEKWESALSNIDAESIQLHFDECDKTNAINFLTQNSITTSQLKDDAITTNKIYDGAVVTDKIYDGAVVTDKVADTAITPNKLDRDYLEKTYIPSIEGYNTLFSTIKTLKDVGTSVSPIEPLQGTIYVIGELKLNLPYIYANPGNSDYYVGPYEKIYSFGKCLAWRLNDTTIYIVSCDKGWIFSIELSSIIPSGEENYYYSSAGQYFKLEFKPIESPMIKNKAITREKINFEAVGTDQIAQKAIKQGQLDENSVITENIVNEAITREKLKDTYLDYKYIGNISEVSDLKEISEEKLFRFQVSSDSDLAQSGFSDGNYIAIPRGSDKSSVSHALINLNDFTTWYLEAGSGYPKPLTNNWKKTNIICYDLLSICNNVTNIDSTYPTLATIQLPYTIASLSPGWYFGYSIPMGSSSGTSSGQKKVILFSEFGKTYQILKTFDSASNNYKYSVIDPNKDNFGTTAEVNSQEDIQAYCNDPSWYLGKSFEIIFYVYGNTGDKYDRLKTYYTRSYYDSKTGNTKNIYEQYILRGLIGETVITQRTVTLTTNSTGTEVTTTDWL